MARYKAGGRQRAQLFVQFVQLGGDINALEMKLEKEKARANAHDTAKLHMLPVCDGGLIVGVAPTYCHRLAWHRVHGRPVRAPCLGCPADLNSDPLQQE